MAPAARPKFDQTSEVESGSTYREGPATSAARAVARLEDIAFELQSGLSPDEQGWHGIEIHEDLAAVEQLWRSFEQYADGTAFQTFEWLATWQRYIGVNEGSRPAVVVGRDIADATLFILPLAIVDRGYGRVLTFLGSDLCDYNAPMLAPDFARVVPHPVPLFERVFARLKTRFNYDVVCFKKMPETVGDQPNPLMKLPVMLHPSGAYMTPLGADWDEFYREKRSSSTRQRDRAKRKKLAGFGEVRLVHAMGEKDISATLDTLMTQKGQAFARMGVSNMFSDPSYRAFYRAMATDAATHSLVHVSKLQVGDEIAAVNLGLTFGDRYYYVLASYGDGEMSRFGPGAAHLRDLMQYAIGRGFRVFDFTVGDEPYKRDWCGESPLYDYIAGASVRGALVAAVLRAMTALKRTIKRNPTLWKFAYRSREWLGRFRRAEAA